MENRLISFSTSLSKYNVAKTYVLDAVFMTYDVYVNINRWFHGEITGKRCAKNVIDKLFSTAVGVGAGIGVGIAAGAFLGPIGAVIGGVVGGLIGQISANSFSDWITSKIFDLPPSEALENAYNHLGLDHSASHSEINRRFRQLSLRHHPDRGGNKEEFVKLNQMMAVIKVSIEGSQDL
jgi:hypothetical protein